MIALKRFLIPQLVPSFGVVRLWWVQTITIGGKTTVVVRPWFVLFIQKLYGLCLQIRDLLQLFEFLHQIKLHLIRLVAWNFVDIRWDAQVGERLVNLFDCAMNRRFVNWQLIDIFHWLEVSRVQCVTTFVSLMIERKNCTVFFVVQHFGYRRIESSLGRNIPRIKWC